jgi:hypothetical protein
MQAFWVTLRILLGVFGGYAISAASSAALALALSEWAGFDRAESTVLCAMLGFGFYLFALLWAFTTPRLSQVAFVLLGGSLLAYGVVRWLSPVALSAPVAVQALVSHAPLALVPRAPSSWGTLHSVLPLDWEKPGAALSDSSGILLIGLGG